VKQRKARVAAIDEHAADQPLEEIGLDDLDANLAVVELREQRAAGASMPAIRTPRTPWPSMRSRSESPSSTRTTRPSTEVVAGAALAAGADPDCAAVAAAAGAAAATGCAAVAGCAAAVFGAQIAGTSAAAQPSTRPMAALRMVRATRHPAVIAASMDSAGRASLRPLMAINPRDRACVDNRGNRLRR